MVMSVKKRLKPVTTIEQQTVSPNKEVLVKCMNVLAKSNMKKVKTFSQVTYEAEEKLKPPPKKRVRCTDKEKEKARHRKYRLNNKEKIKAYHAKQYALHKAKHMAYAREFYARNKHLFKATRDRKRAANKGHKRVVNTIRKVILPASKARSRAYRALPSTKERVRLRNRVRASRINFIEKEYVAEFLHTHPEVQPKSHLITDHQIKFMFEKLLDERSSKITNALGGFTIREAFLERKLYASIYPWLARGSGLDRRPGQNYAECERFLVKDPNPILTNGEYEGGKHYRTGTESFKNLGLVSITLAQFDTASACSRFESYMQNFMDTRRYGMEKLWKKAGAGKLYQKYRRCDITHMEKYGDFKPVYTCGITVLPDVRMASCNTQNFVTSIRSGDEGQLSKINQPARWAKTWARDQAMFGS
jgi:hypothetical protein